MKFKYSFSIISKLYTISLIWFWGTILIIIYIVLNLLFPNTDFMLKGKGYTFGNENLFKNGYSIPTKISIQLPADTVIKYSNTLSSGEINLRKGDYFRSTIADSILNDTTIKKEMYYFKWIARPSTFAMDSGYSIGGNNEIELFNNQIKYHETILKPTVENSYSFTSKIKIKCDSNSKKLTLLIFNLFPLIISFIVSFQFMKIISQLKTNISFEKNIYRRLNIAGITIIVNEVFQFFIGFVFSSWYGAVTLLESSSKIGNSPFKVQFNPSNSANLNVLILGFCILVLSYIFKYGNKLEEENSLTV